MSPKSNAEKQIKNIRRNPRKRYSAEEKIRTVLDSFTGESSIFNFVEKRISIRFTIKT